MPQIQFPIDNKTAALMDAFTAGNEVTDLVFVESKDEAKRTVRVNLQIEALGDLLVSDYGHSILCKLLTAEDILKMQEIEDSASSVLPEKIDFKPFVKDEKFFMKLPFKNDKYKANIDPPALPTQPDKSPFTRGSQLDVEFTVSMWINFSNAAAGLFLTVSKVVIDGGKKKTIKRR